MRPISSTKERDIHCGQTMRRLVRLLHGNNKLNLSVFWFIKKCEPGQEEQNIVAGSKMEGQKIMN
jgi:hypothetical protein